MISSNSITVNINIVSNIVVDSVIISWNYETFHVYSTQKRRGNVRFHVVSAWNTRGVFVGIFVVFAIAIFFGIVVDIILISVNIVLMDQMIWTQKGLVSYL